MLHSFLIKKMTTIMLSLPAPVAQGVLFIRSLKMAVGIVGERGHGFLVARLPDGGWSAPSFVTLTGAGLGWSLGALPEPVVEQRSFPNGH
jgi:lipid-binding SYLF domain-containing protein